MPRTKPNAAPDVSSSAGRPPATGRLTRIVLGSWRPYVWIALLVAAVYGQTLSFGFTNLDDVKLVVVNHPFNRDLANIGPAFRGDVFGEGGGVFYYRPLLTLSLMLDARWGGTRPLAYHLSNVVIHLLACCLLLWLLGKLGCPPARSLLLGAVFAVHPVLTTAVAWIPGRNDALLSLFAIGSFGYFLSWLQEKRWPWLIAHLALLAAALFTKETAAALPVICAAYLLIWPGAKLTGRRTALLAAGWAGALSLWYLARNAAAGNGPQGIIRFSAPADAARGLIAYAGKIIIPVNLSLVPDIGDIKLAYGVIALILSAAVIAASGIASRRRFVFGGIWFLLFLLPAVLTVTEVNAFMDHRIHLALAGLMLMLAELRWVRRGSAMRAPAVTIAGVLVAALAAGSIAYGRVFRDDLACWRQAVGASPGSVVARNLLGVSYARRREWAQAEQQYQQALRMALRFHRAMFNLGELYLAQGKLDQAQRYLAMTLREAPTARDANYDLGQVFERRGLPDSAEQYYRRELAVNPAHVDARAGIGAIRQEQGDWPQAMAEYRQALALRPENAGIHANIGAILQQQGRLPEAEQEYRQALRIDPALAQAHFNLGVLYLAQRRTAEADAEFTAARRKPPSSFKAQP